MKLIVCLFLMLFNINAFANQLGVGVSLGNPTGLNAKYWLDDHTAVDGGFGMSIGKNTDVSLHSDYLLHKEGAFFFNDVHPLDLYYGLGARMEFEDDINLGVRIPVGIAHRVENKSADVFGEVAPVIDFITSSGVEIHFLVGGRYYF